MIYTMNVPKEMDYFNGEDQLSIMRGYLTAIFGECEALYAIWHQTVQAIFRLFKQHVWSRTQRGKQKNSISKGLQKSLWFGSQVDNYRWKSCLGIV